MDRIKKKREEIDSIDLQIMALLDKRFFLTSEIGRIKKEVKKVVLDPYREQMILDKTTKFSHYPQLKEIYHTIMNESKNLQRK